MLHEDEPGAAEFADRLESDGVPVERVRMRTSIDPLVFARLVRSIRRARPDVVHTHLVHADFHGLPAGRLARVPLLVSTKHGFNAFRNRTRVRARPTGPSPRSPTSTSRSRAGLARYLAANEGFDASAFEVVHYGIEPGPRAAAAPRRAAARDRRPADPDQGARRAARGAVALVRERGAGADPRDRGRRAARVAAPCNGGAARARAIASRSSAASPRRRRCYERAEIVVVPSFGEGFGMVALEAMERGRAVIASDVGGLPEIVGERARPGSSCRRATPPLWPERSPSSPATRRAPQPWARPDGNARSPRSRRSAAPSGPKRLYLAALETGGRAALPRTSSQARSSANAASSASTKSHGAR